jgi:Uncharacterised nucleotidyltransferase
MAGSFDGLRRRPASAEHDRVDAFRRVARSMLQDAVTAEVADALDRRGIRSIVLKGPSIARLLYRGDGERSYVDSDFLLAPECLTPAGRELRELGFTLYLPPYGEAQGLEHAEVWSRENVLVDLHWTLPGVEVAPADLWRVLAGSTETMLVATAEVAVLRPEGIAFHVALHAAHHGPASPRSIRDLDLALQTIDGATWRAASDLARRLRATERFAAGLRLLPAGEEIALRLGLADSPSVETVLLTRSQTLLTLGIERLARTPGLRRKLVMLGRELVPTPDVMRTWWPRAARGGPSLVAGYLWRPVWLFIHAGPALIAWRRAVRDSRRRDHA